MRSLFSFFPREAIPILDSELTRWVEAQHQELEATTENKPGSAWPRQAGGCWGGPLFLCGSITHRTPREEDSAAVPPNPKIPLIGNSV